MGEQTKAFLRVANCLKDSRYIVTGRKSRLRICAEHRYRADFDMLIKEGLLTARMAKLSDTKCQAPVFKITGTI